MEFKIKSSRIRKFEELQRGECFTLQGTYDIYMKMEEIVTDDNMRKNIVSLKSGWVNVLGENETVYPVEVEGIITQK